MDIEIILGLLASALGAVLSFISSVKLKKETTLDLDGRVAQLDQMKVNLKELVDFIETQKSKIIEEQEILTELETKKKTLKPIVEANQEIVDAIFETQEKRSKRKRWVDWIMGFFIGVFASLLATYLYSLIDPSAG